MVQNDYCNKIACNLQEFCTTEKLWVSAVHIHGVYNKEANEQSKIFDDATDWQLNPEVFMENL